MALTDLKGPLVALVPAMSWVAPSQWCYVKQVKKNRKTQDVSDTRPMLTARQLFMSHPPFANNCHEREALCFNIISPLACTCREICYN